MSEPRETKKPRGLRPEQWAEVRAKFEAGASEVDLARVYGVDRKTIRARKRKEAWTPHVTPHMGKTEAEAIRDRATSKVIDLASRRAVEHLEASGAVSNLTDSLTDSLVKHASIASRLISAADDLLESFTQNADGDLASTREGTGRDVIVRQGRAEVFAQLVAGVRAAVSVSRDIAGLRAGQASAGDTSDADKPIEVLQRRLDPVNIPVDERGRAVSRSAS